MRYTGNLEERFEVTRLHLVAEGREGEVSGRAKINEKQILTRKLGQLV